MTDDWKISPFIIIIWLISSVMLAVIYGISIIVENVGSQYITFFCGEIVNTIGFWFLLNKYRLGFWFVCASNLIASIIHQNILLIVLVIIPLYGIMRFDRYWDELE
jgi:hypothetical protein